MSYTQQELDAIWSPQEGGLEQNYTLVVENARFASDPNYSAKAGEDRIMLFLEGRSKQSGDARVEKFSCGPGWFSPDGGQSISHPDPTQKIPSANSAFGELILRVASMGAREAFSSSGHPDPRKAAPWVGCEIHFRPDKREFNDKLTGEKRSYTRLVPTSFSKNGVGSSGESASAPNPTPASAPAVSSPGLPPNLPASLASDSGGLAQLQGTAKSTNSEAEFFSAAAKLPVCTSNHEAMVYAMTPGNWSHLRS